MTNEKIKNMFKGKRKTENIVILIIILIITVVAINYIWNEDEKKTDTKVKEENKRKESGVVQVSSNTIQDELEQKLENILSKISGVGKVKVMITYSESSTLKPVYNEDSKTSSTNENDSAGGSRSITETDMQKEIIYKENSDGTKEPVTQSIVSPKIEGAVIAAIGADKAEIKANIIQAVEAATGLATHKIQVFRMEESEN